jgi:hypothetical protein
MLRQTGPELTMDGDQLRRVRAICLALPESAERLSHGVPAFFVRTKTFARYTDAGRYGRAGAAIWCPAPAGVQAELIDAEPHRFFRPPYVGVRGWIGVCLEVEVSWLEITEIVRDAYRLVAPKKLAALL